MKKYAIMKLLPFCQRFGEGAAVFTNHNIMKSRAEYLYL